MLGVVVMTALPPTEGHLALLRFAGSYMRSVGGSLLALMCVLPDEPVGRAEHRDALWEALSHEERVGVRLEIQFSNDPQGPISENDDDFWAHWVQTITRQTGRRADLLFSSESYGERLAAALRCSHVTFDAGRTITDARATQHRSLPVDHFPYLVKPLRDRLRRRIVLFGQESTGKTTLAKGVANRTDSAWAPEWARSYLESLPSPETTSDRMDAIVSGQAAQEAAAWAAAADRGCPFLFLDTDLLSTIGYDEYYASTRKYARDDQWRRRRDRLESLFVPADYYIVCPPNIPMKEDPLRYGGAERETSMKFWIDMLEDRGFAYRVLESEIHSDRITEVARLSTEALASRSGYHGYERRR